VDVATADDKGLDIDQIAADGLAERAFPPPAPFRVLISSAAHDTMWRHARGTVAGQGQEDIKEVGGILVGQLFQDQHGPYLEVNAAIVAEHTRNEGTEVTFTPETWAQVNRVKDQKYATDKIVGWYHTHPNFGIFLSDRDQFLHRHSFPQPWGLAYVIDPVQKSEGLFVWKRGEPREATEYWIGSERRTGRAAAPAVTPVAGEPDRAEPTSSRTISLLMSAAALIVVLAIGVLAYSREVARSERDVVIVQAIESERVELDRAFQILQALRAELERVSTQSTADLASFKGEATQLENGLRKLNDLTRAVERRVRGLEDRAASEQGDAK
jgi:proteasome lid subunit RPN8/RPN11